MKTASKIIAEKFNELIRRSKNSKFTQTERAIQLIVTIRCEMDINGFASVFEQTLSKHELLEAVNCLKMLDLVAIAELFEEIIASLESSNFYGLDSKPVTRIPGLLGNRVKAIGKQIAAGNMLWDIDEKLAEMLASER